MSRPRKNRNPTRCPQCGCLVIEWPKGKSCCYGCLFDQDQRQREQKYIHVDAPVETVGAITSRPSEPQEETK